MLNIFFEIKAIVHTEFVLAGKTVNSAYYCDILRRLHENVRKLRSLTLTTKELVLHHYNALPYTSFFTREL
jgi:hypothetical protein